jgi:predicted Co/Zn/Cd cation transporter (cation efflux family)
MISGTLIFWGIIVGFSLIVAVTIWPVIGVLLFLLNLLLKRLLMKHG